MRLEGRIALVTGGVVEIHDPASGDASFVAGQTINVSGGLSTA